MDRLLNHLERILDGPTVPIEAQNAPDWAQIGHMLCTFPISSSSKGQMITHRLPPFSPRPPHHIELHKLLDDLVSVATTEELEMYLIPARKADLQSRLMSRIQGPTALPHTIPMCAQFLEILGTFSQGASGRLAAFGTLQEESRSRKKQQINLDSLRSALAHAIKSANNEPLVLKLAIHCQITAGNFGWIGRYGQALVTLGKIYLTLGVRHGDKSLDSAITALTRACRFWAMVESEPEMSSLYEPASESDAYHHLGHAYAHIHRQDSNHSNLQAMILLGIAMRLCIEKETPLGDGERADQTRRLSMMASNALVALDNLGSFVKTFDGIQQPMRLLAINLATGTFTYRHPSLNLVDFCFSCGACYRLLLDTTQDDPNYSRSRRILQRMTDFTISKASELEDPSLVAMAYGVRGELSSILDSALKDQAMEELADSVGVLFAYEALISRPADVERLPTPARSHSKLRSSPGSASDKRHQSSRG